MFVLDPNTEFGARVARRLQQEMIVWLVTSRPNGQSEPSPVWFLWGGESFLIYSQPGMPKLRNIAANPRVSLHLNSTTDGRDIIVISGHATIVQDAPPATGVPAFLLKYAEGIANLGTGPETWAAAYNVAIRIFPTHLRGF